MSLGASGLVGDGPPGDGLVGGGPFAGAAPTLALRTPRSILFHVRPTAPGAAPAALRPWPARRLVFFSARTAPPADLLEALAAFLPGQGALAAAFGDAPETPKFWADVAPLGVALPLCVYAEHAEPERYESPDGTGSVGVIEEGEVDLAVYAATKAEARALRRRLVAALDDAPLAFASGTLLYFRARRRAGALGPEMGPDGVDAWVDRLVVRYSVGRDYAPAS